MITKIIIVVGGIITTVAYLILAERKVAGFIQERYGPNRVGIWGLLQPVADGVKTLLKEDITPARANRIIYHLAPAMVLAPALVTFAVVPFGSGIDVFGRHITFQIADINIGILFIFAITSIGVYGVVLGGWSSNNKYSLLGGIRSSAQMISYELALGLSVIGILLLTGSLRLNDIVEAQIGMWNVFRQPVAFIIFVVAIF
ncbi:MAG: NADH-quinone oxidoreductase subunit H, partial [Candidatus Marinimicrobia bacterium]|nr:NADH-quinone oxidoreductase subunit H [Candidatus Neomarinimicrobiota bacterium]